MTQNLLQVINASVKNLIEQAIQIFLVAKKSKNFRKIFLHEVADEKKDIPKVPIVLAVQSINAIRENIGMDTAPHIPGNVNIGTQAFAPAIDRNVQPEKPKLAPKRLFNRSRFKGGTSRGLRRGA